MKDIGIRRRIAYMQNWHSFFTEQHIVIPMSTDMDENICNALRCLSSNNNVKRINDPDSFIRMTLYFKDEEIIDGYFTVKQIEDLKFLDNRIKAV